MQIQITSKKLEVTDAMKSHLENKMRKIKKHFDHIISAHVIFSTERGKHIVEATVHISGNELFAKNDESDMYASIDGLVDKLDRQIIKYKEKLKRH
ncbi:MAG: ribosomal subunit interface protein [Thiotrichales bacterium]|nr:MAG: ribosomal subunit interface protein [Thiotrichales bacterium]